MHKLVMIIGGTIPREYRSTSPGVTIYDSTTLTQAVEIAKKLNAEGAADVIISPAGTAAELQRHIALPIVLSDPSRFDILETLHYAERKTGLVNGRIALVLHHSRALDVRAYAPFIHNQLCYYTYESEKDIESLVNQLALQGITVLVGGPTALHAARARGIEGFILRLGIDSLQNAVNQANSLLAFGAQLGEQSRRLELALNLSADGVLMVGNTGLVVESNQRAAAIFGMTREQLIGMQIERLTNDSSCVEAYLRGVQQLDRIVELPGGNLFSSRIPVLIDGKVQGAVLTFQDATKIEKLEHKYRQYQSLGLVAKYHFKDIIGDSPALTTTKEKAKAFSLVDSTILIRGETGSGKELFAQSVHNFSHRRKGPFVAVNCAALPEQLLESELFGYEEGAFTGARRGGKTGLFELAHNGTIFLDEVNCIPIQLQANILRVLQERQVLRLGGNRMIPINVRIVAASNEDLLKLIREGRMREDLYYRLNVLNLTIPPLRDHREDIVPLVQYYFGLFTRQYGSTAPFTSEALRLLENHVWPGNTRELINCVERYVVISRHLMSSDLEFVAEYLQAERPRGPIAMSTDPDRISVLPGTLPDMERQLIASMLEHCHGNKLQAALALGISRTTLWKKLQDRAESPV